MSGDEEDEEEEEEEEDAASAGEVVEGTLAGAAVLSPPADKEAGTSVLPSTVSVVNKVVAPLLRLREGSG